jgi:flagellar basal-body rod modification protein FlgD
MLTNSSTATGSPAAGAAADNVSTQAPSNETKDMFTRLLVAQIRNQDPLSPSDPSEFVNQLAQLSQTEALQNLSKLSGASASVLESLQVLALGAQVGSEVMASTSTVTLGRNKVEGNIALASGSASTDLVLTGADGNAHTIALGARSAGALAFTIDPAALGLPPGAYAMQVKTSSAESPNIEIAGRLDSVRMSPTGGIVLKVANVGEIAPGAVTGFNGKSGALASAAPSSSAAN